MLINTLILIILIIKFFVLISHQNLIIKSDTAICPLKCFCNEELFSIYCSNLSRTEVRHLFISGGAFPTQFSASLQNLSIINSEIENMGIFPRMEKLLVLNLRGNNLEHVGMGEKSFREPSGDSIRSQFPSLISLDLSENKITSISRSDFISFPNIEEINLNQNRIVSVEWEAFRLLKLKKLILRGNYLLTINEHMMRDSPAIEELDLSHNLLSVAQSSSFFAAQKLKSLNLSHNRLHRFDYDSFSPLFQLESLDLSYNNFSTIPADLRQFVALRTLNFSGNPITKICEGEIVQPMLQNLDISNCPNLRLIEQRTFSFTPVLQFLKLANNSQLQYISPYAFQNSLLYELVISNNSLETIDNKILEQPTRLFISGNPLDCSCAEETFTNFTHKIVDLKEATCKARKSQNSTSTLPLTTIIKSLFKLNQKCSNKPLILPFGNYLSANVGEYFSLYCAPRRLNENTFLSWKLPNGTIVQSDEQIKDTVVFNIPTIIQSFTKDGTSTWIPFHKQRQRNPRFDTPTNSDRLRNIHNHQHQRERVQVTDEQLRFEVIMLEDAGEYICSVDGVEAKLNLSVHSPSIQIKPVEIGSHYVALVWNDSLKIRALERVQLSLQIRDSITGQTGRITQLSLYNPWHSYNVVRLRPLTNYTICLVYSLRSIEANSDVHNTNIDSSAKLLYKSCIDVKTLEQMGFWSSLSPTTIVIFCVLIFICCFLFCFRAIYMHFYIWHDAKMRARMNQSMSGQSFLSHSSSLPLPTTTNSNGINNGHNSGTLTHPNETFFDSNSATLNKTSLITETDSESFHKKSSINKLSKIKRKSKLSSKQQIRGNSMFLMENSGEEKHLNKSTENIALC
uniref:Ig-like domain-containing protein n=1 Tax=Meloidogyne enterolobii TaxID=390850 RepID=A0A6V7X4J3_MELEN|nr:unnamed protein product [Meloidogyne enterolobii]